MSQVSEAREVKAQVPRDASSLASAFEHTVARFPSRIAVTSGSEQISYADLDRRSAQVASALTSLSLPPEAIVAIYLDRSIDMVVAMLGTIRAGATYLPLDITFPPLRTLETLADAAPAAILTDQSLAPKLASSNIPTLNIHELPSTPSLPLPAPGPDAVAYVIYTSGSTGKPKGVRVTHRNVLRLFTETDPWFHFTEHDVWTMFHSFAFDFSVWEMWGPLLTGGRLVIVPFTTSRSPEDFQSLLAAQRVTVLNQTPSAFLLLNPAAPLPALRPALRVVILGGEALNFRSLRPWFSHHGDRSPEIVNMYGITETTVHVTYRRVTQADADTETDSLIGVPIPDLHIHLLDQTLQPVPEGEPGEICIAGPGVALGYLARPDLTAQRFLPDPLGPPGSRLYRSGDLARRRPDGELVFLGRADRQVKINGFRIELGEIEAALLRCPGITQACVLPHPDPTRLAAWFVAPAHLPQADITHFLADHLPAHMRPSFYTRLDALPLNHNGKIDRTALPIPTPPSTPAPHRAGSSLEAQVAAVWRSVLGTDTLRPDENFFDVGGTSLLLIRVRTTLQDQLARPIPIAWLFEFPTIASLAARLAETPTTPTPSTNTRADQQRASFARARAARGASR